MQTVSGAAGPLASISKIVELAINTPLRVVSGAVGERQHSSTGGVQAASERIQVSA